VGLLDTDKYLPGHATAGDPHGVKLRQAVREAGDAQCALCRLLEDEERARLHWLAYEGLADASLRKKLLASRGFCVTHTRLLYTVVVEQTRNLSAIAQVMRELSAADLEALEGAERAWSGRGRSGGAQSGRRVRASIGRLLAALQPAATCPACDTAATVLSQKAETFATALEDGVFREAYVHGAGALCRPHLRRVLAEVTGTDQAEALIAKHVGGLQRDVAELDEFLRKVDYRFAAEPKGDEQRAPLRSLLRFIGTWPR
jgi:hypothetical protein